MDFEEDYPRHIYQNCLCVQQHVLSYLQKVCVSICSSLGPVLANIIVKKMQLLNLLLLMLQLSFIDALLMTHYW